MKLVLIVALALLVSNPADSKKHESQWKSGTVTFLKVQTDQASIPPQPHLSVPPGIQVTPQTWTYQVEGKEGVYTVKIVGPEPLTDASPANLRYDLDGKIMHIETAVDGQKPKIKDLKILK